MKGGALLATLFWGTNLGNEGVLYGDFNRLQQQKQEISRELTRRGFNNVRVTNWEISGHKDGCYVSIAHLSHPTPNRWWEIIMVSCDGNNIPLAQTILNQARNAIRFTW
jgi:hypothetical protein